MSRAPLDPKLPLPPTGDDPAARLFYPGSYFDRLTRRIGELFLQSGRGTDALRAQRKSGDYQATVSDGLVIYDCTSNDATLTLPAANEKGSGYLWRISVVRIDNSGYSLIVAPKSGNTIDGLGSATIAGTVHKEFESDGVDSIYTVT